MRTKIILICLMATISLHAQNFHKENLVGKKWKIDNLGSSILCNNSYKWMQYGLSFVALLEIYAVMVKKGTWKGS